MQDLWWTKWHWGRFSLANVHSTNCSILINLTLYCLNTDSVVKQPSYKKITSDESTEIDILHAQKNVINKREYSRNTTLARLE
jgi:hypothetical protein